METRQANPVERAKPLSRTFTFNRESINEDERTVELVFSTETPVPRWFGDEILDHAADSVNLARLNDNGPILVDHDPRDHVGVVNTARIDTDRKGRLVMRFGRSARADEIFTDVKDGIRTKTSVSYRIHEMDPEDWDEKSGEVFSWRATNWEPFEVSFVSIPADVNSAVGRSRNPDLDQENDIKFNIPDGVRKMDPTENKNTENRATTVQGHSDADLDTARSAAAQGAADAHQARTLEVLAAGEQFARLNGNAIAAQVLRDGGGLAEFNVAMLAEHGRTDATEAEGADLDLTDKETRRYSFLRALNALANPGDSRAREAAAFEFECSQAAAQKTGREARGIIVPADIMRASPNMGLSAEQFLRMQRDLTVGTATAGGHTVSTDLLTGSFIDMLRNSAVMMQPGMATVLTDLNGNIAIPRQTGGATGYWVAEGSSITESQQAFDQLTLSPNTVGGQTEYSRKLLIQSSMDVEQFVRADLALTVALEIDRAAINGSGSGAEPEGILNATGIGSVALGTNGAAPTWGSIVDLETEVAQDNAAIGNLRYVSNAKMRGKLKKTDVGTDTGRFIMEGRELNGYEVMTTNQVPSNLVKGSSGAVCSAALFGNWRDLIIAFWSGLDINVNPYANDSTGAVRITALQDCDIGLRHVESFAAIADALTT